ncbi:NTP transferase domain-containing protein [Marinococcus halophilus]|uniref:NTP transferase domain-containing protein n=1 Tax=Marinococcus halophilus TaxID=1371 RepID=UPI0036126857
MDYFTSVVCGENRSGRAGEGERRSSSSSGKRTARRTFYRLSYTEEEWVFMLPVDMPLITKAEIRFLASYISPETEAVIPEAAGRIAPACGWFHADLLSKAEAQLESGDYRMKKVFSGKEKVIDVNQMYWRPEAFENINTAWQLEELNRKVK